VAVIGAMQGDALLPLHCSASLVNFLKNIISESKILGDILILPSINHYALNISQKFWPLDKTNLNMMFPGYLQGETTQRIAGKIFEAIKGYDYGIILETPADQSTCMPHIKLLKTGWEDLVGAKKFGFQFIHNPKVESIDTVTLQYNWQLWETKAYSIICPSDQRIDQSKSDQIVQAMIRFFDQNKILNYHIYNSFASSVISNKDIKTMKTPKSGMFTSFKNPGDHVNKGDIMGKIIDALTGEIIHRFKSPENGMITNIYSNALIIENAIVYQIAKIG
ncbi:MAG: succinylglutamate desuccinylase/aspartoacylase family protein, partial [Campylobacterales bacterium]|nr:succinylglutamate desuccinylase/aspartoacylase family protein [Campylobacterales bacterium]